MSADTVLYAAPNPLFMLLRFVKALLILFLIYSFKAVRKSLFRLEPFEGMYQCPFQLHSQGY